MPITTQAELLELGRSSLYYKPVEPSPEEISFKHKIIDEIQERICQGYGQALAPLALDRTSHEKKK